MVHAHRPQEAGAAFITIHPRTKRQTYEGRADWGLIARARQLLRIPVVGLQARPFLCLACRAVARLLLCTSGAVHIPVASGDWPGVPMCWLPTAPHLRAACGPYGGLNLRSGSPAWSMTLGMPSPYSCSCLPHIPLKIDRKAAGLSSQHSDVPIRAVLALAQVGNGDVVSVAAARQLLQETGCHAIMAGRGVVQVRNGGSRSGSLVCFHEYRENKLLLLQMFRLTHMLAHAHAHAHARRTRCSSTASASASSPSRSQASSTAKPCGPCKRGMQARAWRAAVGRWAGMTLGPGMSPR